MDILEQYEKENSQVFSRVSQWEPSQEYGGLTHFVVRIFGGRIQNERQASLILLGIVTVATLIAFIIFFTTQHVSDSSKIYSPVAQPVFDK